MSLPASRAAFLPSWPFLLLQRQEQSTFKPPTGKFFLWCQISHCFSALKTPAAPYRAQQVIQKHPPPQDA